MDGSTLLGRAKAIRLSTREIARRTGLDHHTIRRLDDPNRSPLASSRDRVRETVEAEELRLRDQLIERHGLPDREAFMVGGHARRVVKPTVEPKENAA